MARPQTELHFFSSAMGPPASSSSSPTFHTCPILSNPSSVSLNVTFVGVGIKADKAKLFADYGVACGNVVELGNRASIVYGKAEYEKYGLVDLASMIAGIRVEKPQHVRVGDWSVGMLDEEQIRYATVDAYASFAVGKVLMGL
ncbi:hypothetical protein QJS10_CPB17g00969 [Acorus calamus]|uniref:3'-5' exonuclease domain-containing protein n=1 Tax=Acorus calamus TaxID=4465 RepID=A0AAV9CUG6_ACOCL|nr:hypothetical protein QJS10_CPB17g00969 [Acorus calamus]